MKLRQKIYDSSESINRLIKITNSFHHYNNLKKIKERKPLYHNLNNYNYNRNKKLSNNENYKYYNYNKQPNNIIINSIGNKKFSDWFGGSKNDEIKIEKYNIQYRKRNKSNENNKNNEKIKHKNKSDFILPPIKNSYK